MPPIKITADMAEVLEAYLKTRNTDHVQALIKKSNTYVRNRLSRLSYVGLLESNPGKPYTPTNKAYKIVGADAMPKDAIEPKVTRIEVEMSAEERKWMRKNYVKNYQKKRREAAKILGRTVYDINLMAIALGLDRKSL